MGISEEMVQEYIDFERSERLPEGEKAILRLAVRSTTDPQKTTDSDVEAVKAFGYTDADIV